MQAGRPDSPPRQRWFVQRDTWDRELVIDRCREWAVQTGGPPSYYDWCPIARGQQAGAPARAAAKWEREHPYWPSTSVVYRYMRGWREMLLLAGFPAQAVIELPFAERVREALRLRADGLRWAEIGDLLGISPDTARRYVRVHDCERCGEPILATGVRLCRGCSAANRSRWGEPFSGAEIVAAIRTWRHLEGRAPAQVDWHPADRGGSPRWERECPRWPPASQVIDRFGSWNAGLQAAGFDRPRPPVVGDEQIIAALRTYDRERGCSPSSQQWRTQALSPSVATIEGRFGSWSAALAAAGLPPRRVRREWSDRDILDGLRRFAADHGRPPRTTDRVGLLSTYPSPALAISRFGSWSAALTEAGLQPGNPPPASDRDVARALRAYRREYHRSPTTTAWRRAKCRPAAETIIRHCGSWAAALDLAGIDPPEHMARGADREQLISVLQRYAKEHGTSPSLTEWRRLRMTPALKPFYRVFGSWPAALAAAGLPTPASLANAARERWGEQEIIAALHAHRAARGETPRGRDWPASTAEHPSMDRVVAVFGSWRAAVEAAGLPPRPVKTRWTADKVIELLRADAAALGRTPAVRDWDEAREARPGFGTVVRLFGSWNVALEASGLPVNLRYGHWTRERILDALRQLEQELGRPPVATELNPPPDPAYPPAAVVARTFGSWRAAARELGWPQRPRRPDTAIQVSLREAICEFGQLPSRARWQQLAPARDWPSAYAVARQFGSWGAVREAAVDAAALRSMPTATMLAIRHGLSRAQDEVISQRPVRSST